MSPVSPFPFLSNKGVNQAKPKEQFPAFLVLSKSPKETVMSINFDDSQKLLDSLNFGAWLIPMPF